MKEFKDSVKGHTDFELDIKRTTRVNYKVCCPDKGPADGLVFVIPGFGDDTLEEYNQVLRRYIADAYNLIAVTVDYHAMRSRPTQGAKRVIDPESIFKLIGRLAVKGTPYRGDPNDVTAVLTHAAKTDGKYVVEGTIKPPRDEYQNFGVLQALDHLTALGHLLTGDLDFNRANIVCLGSSHGAYIAHLVAKFAPNTIAMVIDNSAYTRTNYHSIGGLREFHEIAADNVRLQFGALTHWKLTDHHHANFFGPAEYAIRDLENADHIRSCRDAAEQPCRYRMVNGEIDRMSPLDRKRRLCETLTALGFDATLDVITEADLDGKTFKNTDHGLGAALNGVFDRYYEPGETTERTLDFDRGTVLAFDCYDKIYALEFTAEAPYVTMTRRQKPIPEPLG